MAPEAPFRAFYAAPLADAAGALEAATRAEVEACGERGWRPVPAARIHVTLKFLGDAEPGQVPALGRALREAAAATRAFPVAFEGWLRLPSPRDARVLAVGVSDPTGSLPRLAAFLEERAEALGFPREGRPFLSHATVARRRRGGGRAVPLPASGKVAKTMPGQVVSRIVLFRSTLGPDGPAYDAVDEAALATV